MHGPFKMRHLPLVKYDIIDIPHLPSTRCRADGGDVFLALYLNWEESEDLSISST